jgi:hypothetical protein
MLLLKRREKKHDASKNKVKILWANETIDDLIKFLLPQASM